MAGVVGLEPTLTVLETAVLPLYDTPKLVVPEVGLEPTRPHRPRDFLTTIVFTTHEAPSHGL